MSGEDKCQEDDKTGERDREQCGQKGILFYLGWSGNMVSREPESNEGG